MTIMTLVLKQLTPTMYLKILSYKYFKISLQIYIIVVKNKKTTYFHFLALKTDNSLFCNLDISTIHNVYCVSNAVEYNIFLH